MIFIRLSSRLRPSGFDAASRVMGHRFGASTSQTRLRGLAASNEYSRLNIKKIERRTSNVQHRTSNDGVAPLRNLISSVFLLLFLIQSFRYNYLKFLLIRMFLSFLFKIRCWTFDVRCSSFQCSMFVLSVFDVRLFSVRCSSF